MRQSIRGYADAVIDAAQDTAGAIASEIDRVRAVLAGSEDLAAALGDPGLPAHSRRNLIQDLFASRVSEPTVGLLSFVIESDRAGDVQDDIGWLADRFGAAAGGMEPSDEPVLGLKAAEERVNGYATAVLAGVRDHAQLAEVEDELFRYQRIVNGSIELRDALTDRDLPAAARRALVGDLLRDKVTPATMALATYATRVGRPRDYEYLLESLVDRVGLEIDRRLADVHSAVELNDDQQRKLASALSRAVGQQVEVRVTVDRTVVAGFVARVGDTVVDASARHQLELARSRLVNAPSPQTTNNNTDTGERH